MLLSQKNNETCKKYFETENPEKYSLNECNDRKSEQAHIPHAPTLLENVVYNE